MLNQYKYLLCALFFAITTQASQNISLMDRTSPKFRAELAIEKAAIAQEYVLAPKKRNRNASAMTSLARLANSACNAQPVITGAVVGLASTAIHHDYTSGILYGALAGYAVDVYTNPKARRTLNTVPFITAASAFNYEPNPHFNRMQGCALSTIIGYTTVRFLDYAFGSNNDETEAKKINE